MAWRSSGTTNDEMVNNLKRFQVISSSEVESGFRNVDRRFFVPENRQAIAHSDQPIKEGHVHISAPHIYGSVLEALELRTDAAYSFLNAGSGTCYLTCIAASILGPRSVHYCIELHDDVVQHAKGAVARWKESFPPAQNICNIDILHGNALELDSDKGQCALGFDRIYIGAAIDKEDLPKFKKLLKPGGILVGPVEDELVKVIRVQSPSQGRSGQEFTTQVISGVHFAPLISQPSMKIMIPARVWSPSSHQFYPDTFRAACKEVLLCSNASADQPVKPVQHNMSFNAASMLPRALWVEVLSYTHRDWFDRPVDELEFLRRRLAEEQANTERANEARLEAETRCHIAEKERDVYRLLALRWRSRVNASSVDGTDSDNGSIEEAAAAVLFGGRDSLSVLGLGNIFRRFRTRMAVAQNEEDEELEIDDGNDEVSEQDTADRMDDDADGDDDEDGDAMNEEMEGDDSDISEGNDDEDDSLSMGSDHRISMVGIESTQSKNRRPQVRTVSLAEGDFLGV